jgi:prepilin-type N-terminal cleavage/methylation domain-containing protein
MLKIKKLANGFTAVEIIVVIAVLVIIGLVSYYIGTNSNTNKNSSSASTSAKASSTPTASQAANNTLKQNDALSIGATIADYIDTNLLSPTKVAVGSTSKTLDICGSSCSASTTVPVTLRYYTALAVSMQPYSSKLTVTNTQKVYIVQNASCNNELTEIAPPNSGKQYNVAVLYALQSGSILEQKCYPN